MTSTRSNPWTDERNRMAYAKPHTLMRRTELTVRRRAILGLVMVVMVAAAAMLLVHGARAWGFTTERLRRAEEIVARESYLYRQLANQEGVLESQRRIYMERFRRLEAELQQRAEDVFVLRERLVAMQSQRSNDIEAGVNPRPVQSPSSSPFTGGQEQ